MEVQVRPGLVLRFCRPSGAPSRQPSKEMTEALRQFSDTEEMRQFVADAQAQCRKVVVQVFHSSQGHPLLIHTAAIPRSRK